MVEEVTKNLDRSPYYYPPYDQYDTFNVAPTDHYLLCIVPYGTTLPNAFGVYFYLNTNIVSNYPTNSSNFIICSDYAPYASFNTATISTFSSSCKCVLAKFNKVGDPLLPSGLFRYYLGNLSNNNAVNSEYDLHCMTSANPNYPSSLLATNTGQTLIKSIYALGDVTRDGSIDQSDIAAIQQHLLHNAQADPSRTTAEGEYDQIVFELAADFNQDGLIDMSDTVSIAQYIFSQN